MSANGSQEAYNGLHATGNGFTVSRIAAIQVLPGCSKGSPVKVMTRSLWVEREFVMQSFVATSIASNAAEAGKEVAGKIKAGIGDAKVAMAYGSCDYDSK